MRRWKELKYIGRKEGRKEGVGGLVPSPGSAIDSLFMYISEAAMTIFHDARVATDSIFMYISEAAMTIFHDVRVATDSIFMYISEAAISEAAMTIRVAICMAVFTA